MRPRTTLIAAVAALAAAFPATADAAPPCETQPEVRVLSDGHGILESVAVDRRGRLFFTDSTNGLLYKMGRPGGRVKLVLEGIDGPGGIVFRRGDGNLLLGFGDTAAQAADGTENPEAGLFKVNPRTGEAAIHTEGLQMANGVARGPSATIYASNDITGGIDRVRKRVPQLNWAPTNSANGMVADRARRSLFVNQTFQAAAISRVPFDDPGSATVYFSAAPADAAAGLDGLARGSGNQLFAAANGAGEVWRVDGPASACVLAERDPFPSGPSDVAFGRKKGKFPRQNLYVTTFGGELLELVGARG